MITKKEVQRIAQLARLGINKKEEERFQKELSSILEYVEKLKKADVSKTEPTSHPLQVENIMRSDEAAKTCLPAGREKQKLLPGFLKVKAILNPVRSSSQKKLS